MASRSGTRVLSATARVRNAVISVGRAVSSVLPARTSTIEAGCSAADGQMDWPDRDAVSRRAIETTLAGRPDGALALIGGGEAARRGAAVFEQLGKEDLVLPLDGELVIVLAVAGPADRLMSRLCRCQMAAARFGDAVPMGVALNSPTENAARVMQIASDALAQAAFRGPSEIQIVPARRDPTVLFPAANAGTLLPRPLLSPVRCADSGRAVAIFAHGGPERTGVRTTGDLQNRLRAIASVADERPIHIVLPLDADFLAAPGTIDLLSFARDAEELQRAQTLLLIDPVDPRAVVSSNRADIEIAAPLRDVADAGRDMATPLWLPPALTLGVADDPGRRALLIECLSAAADRRTIATGVDMTADAIMLSQLGVAMIEGRAVGMPCPPKAYPALHDEAGPGLFSPVQIDADPLRGSTA